MPHLAPLAAGKPFPSELNGIVNQLLGIATWAALATCAGSLIALIIIIQLRRKTSAEALDQLFSGALLVVVVAGVVGVAAPFVNWLYA